LACTRNKLDEFAGEQCGGSAKAQSGGMVKSGEAAGMSPG